MSVSYNVIQLSHLRQLVIRSFDENVSDLVLTEVSKNDEGAC